MKTQKPNPGSFTRTPWPRRSSTSSETARDKRTFQLRLRLEQVLYSEEVLRQRQEYYKERVAVFSGNRLVANLQYPLYNMKINNDGLEEQNQLFFKEYLEMEMKYGVSRYQELPICVICPGFNNNKNFRIEKTLNSIFTQNYTNYKVVITDDASTDGTPEVIEKYIEFYEIEEDRVVFVKNTKRMYSGYTMYHAIMEHCNI